MRIRADGYAKCFRCGWVGWLDGRVSKREAEAARQRQRRYPRIIDKIVAETVPLTPESPPGRYLRSRRLVAPWGDDPGWPDDIRSHAGLKHGPSKEKFPAMVTLLRDRGGKLRAIHRTYLTAGGHKAPVEPVRMVLGSLKGVGFHAEPLPTRTPAGELVYGPGHAQPRTVVCVCEGIEDALALRLFYPGFGAWATISASNMRSNVPPPSYRYAKVVADDDRVGRRAAEALFALMRDAGWGCSVSTVDGFKDAAEAWEAHAAS